MQQSRKTLQAITMGCSKNRVDTEHVLAQAVSCYDILPEESEGGADILLINTCGFIGDAKEESIQTVLQAVERKKAGDYGRVVVFGCLSQRYADELPGLIPEVDAWFGARDFKPMLEYLEVPVTEDFQTRRCLTTPSHYAFLKISEGCDRRCAYCAIPNIRGRHVSVPMEELVKEAEMLAAKGVRELIVIAQDTTYYGLDLYRERKLAELLERLSAVDGIEWIRIHYSYPDGFPDDVLDVMAGNAKVCRYMDIPLQHISDKVLGKMLRHVDGAWTRALIARMRERVPGVVLRTTMIVGHPGEGKKEFNELLDFVKEAKFERLGAFTYSEEEGTYSAMHYKDNVSQEVKQARLDKLMALQQKISSEIAASNIGKTFKVIIDRKEGDYYVGRTEFSSPEVDPEVLIPLGNKVLRKGAFYDVKITDAEDFDLFGVVQ